MKKRLLFLFIICIASALTLLATPPSLNDLMKSDIIIIGHVGKHTFKEEKKVDFDCYAEPISVYPYEVDITVRQVLRGDKFEKVKIVGLLSPKNSCNYIGMQGLEPNKTHLLFLREKDGKNQGFIPVYFEKYGLKITEQIPDLAKETLRENVCEIAKENIKSKDIFVARRWAEAFQEISDPKTDLPVWRTFVKDSRLPIKGVALIWLATHYSNDPGLRKDMLKYLVERAMTNQQMGHIEFQVRNLLPKVPNTSDVPSKGMERLVEIEIQLKALEEEIRKAVFEKHKSPEVHRIKDEMNKIPLLSEAARTPEFKAFVGQKRKLTGELGKLHSERRQKVNESVDQIKSQKEEWEQASKAFEDAKKAKKSIKELTALHNIVSKTQKALLVVESELPGVKPIDEKINALITKRNNIDLEIQEFVLAHMDANPLKEKRDQLEKELNVARQRETPELKALREEEAKLRSEYEKLRADKKTSEYHGRINHE